MSNEESALDFAFSECLDQPSIMEFPMTTRTGRQLTAKAVFDPAKPKPITITYWLDASPDHVVTLYGDGGVANSIDEVACALQRDTVTDVSPLLCFLQTAAALLITEGFYAVCDSNNVN